MTDQPAEQPVEEVIERLPDDVMARIDITTTETGIRLREAMPTSDLVAILRSIADEFEAGNVERTQ